MVEAELSESKKKIYFEVVDLIIESVNLRHVPREQFQLGTVFGPPGLGLDSVDILEIIIAVEQKFKLKFPDAEMARVHLQNLGTLVDFISLNNNSKT